jgi:outer membrane protein TolC
MRIVLALAAWAALSAEPRELTLREAASIAASEAPAVEQATARADAAAAAAGEARSRLGPGLTLDAGFVSTDDPVDVFGLTLKQQRFSAQDFFAGNPNEPSAIRDWSAALSASWSADLFGVHRSSFRAARAGREAARLALRRARDGAALEAVAAFVQARRGQDSREILAARQADAARDVELADSLRDAGVVTAADPARARAALAEVRAQAAAAEAAERSGRAALARRIGAENAARPLAPVPSGSLPVGTIAATRPDVEAAELEAASARELERSARAGRWPSLALGARYELHAPRPTAHYGDSLAASAGVRVPLFASGAVGARVAQAGAQARSAEAAARERRLSAEEDVARARADLAAADARVQAFSDEEAAARQAREIQQERYREGAARLTDLLEARAAETGARLGAIAARADRALAESNLRFALGLPIEGEEKP